jgi:RNA 2',3'-cyclic 3'-phosphodiesterase
MEATADSRVRAFIGIDLPETLKENIMSSAARLQDEGFRLVGADNMHITLFFLGDIDKRQQRLVCEAMDRQKGDAFDISVAGFGTFLARRPDLIFARIGLGKRELLDIHRSLSEELKNTGIKLERRYYVPHITVAKARGTYDRQSTKDFIDESSKMSLGEFMCDSIALKQSVLTGAAPIYTDLHVKHLRLLRKQLGAGTQ